MGFIHVKATVAGARGKARIKFLVDSGAMYTLLPEKVWRRLGLRAIKSMAFELADGTEVQRGVSECKLTLDGESRHTPVILGEKGDAALLGIVTLEEFGLVLNPFKRTFQPMRGMLAKEAGHH
jgi:clan AA aspartic protease